MTPTSILLSAIDLRRSRAFRACRVRLGLSQSDLARALDVEPSTILRWERGERRIPGAYDLAMQELETRIGKRVIKGKER